MGVDFLEKCRVCLRGTRGVSSPDLQLVTWGGWYLWYLRGEKMQGNSVGILRTGNLEGGTYGN